MRHRPRLLPPLAAFAASFAIVAVTSGAPVSAAESASPPGAPIPGSGFPDTAVTVTSAGDPATTAALRASFRVGAMAQSRVVQWDRGTETYSQGSASSSSDYDDTVTLVGNDEVVSAQPDGSARIRYVQSSGEHTLTFSNPDHQVEGFDYGVLDGAPILVDYGPGRQSTAIYQDGSNALTSEQLTFYGATRFEMSIPLPAEAVGVGATWTWVDTIGLIDVSIDVTMTARLDAIDGDRYHVTTTYSADVPTAPGLELGDDTTTVVAGTVAGTTVVDGSLTDPLDYHSKAEETYHLETTLTDGVDYTVDGATTNEFWEVSASTAPEASPSSTAPTTAPTPTPVTAAPLPSSGPTTSVATMPEPTTLITDDAGALTVAVPASWASVRTTPNSGGRPQIIASTDLSIFSPNGTIPTEYTTPGLVYFTTDPIPFDTATAATFLVFEGCTEGDPSPYADGTFTGTLLYHDACNGTASRVAVLAANRDDGEFGVALIVVLTEPGNAEIAGILASLDGDPSD